MQKRRVRTTSLPSLQSYKSFLHGLRCLPQSPHKYLRLSEALNVHIRVHVLLVS